jgi:membrane protease YdiL (CAAX protease family)
MAHIAIMARPATRSRFKRLITAHPLMSYFVIAFIGTWAFWLPIALSRVEHGLGLLPFAFSDGAMLLCLVLGGFAGPPVAALTLSAMSSGRAGVGQLLRRCLAWRVGIQWYLIILFGFLGIFLVGFSIVYGANLSQAFLAQWSLLFTVFVPFSTLSILKANFAEEIGWRGFALPRLQGRYGPIVGTVILGALHSLWHMPLFFTAQLGPTSLPHFAGFVGAGIGLTVLYTWLFNHTQGSVLLATLAHGCSNGALPVVGLLIPANVVVRGWAAPLVYGGWNGDLLVVIGGAALLLLVFTRGRLGYKTEQNAQLSATSPTTVPSVPSIYR